MNYEKNSILFYDSETSIFNKGNPFDERNKLVSYVTINSHGCKFSYYTDPDFLVAVDSRLQACQVVCGFNIKFDIHWLRNRWVCVPPHVKIWDLQLAEFIYSGQQLPYDSLNAACERYGLPRKPDLVKEYWDQGISTEDIPLPILQEYNEHDVISTKALYEIQQKLLSEKQKQLVLLEGEDLRTLQAAEYAGIKYDRPKATALVVEQGSVISGIEQSLSKYLPDGIPDNYFNWDSGDHLSAFLYGGSIEFKYATPEKAIYKSGPNKGQEYAKNKWSVHSVDFPKLFTPIEKSEVAKTASNPMATTRFYQTSQPILQQLRSKTKESKDILALLMERGGKIKIEEMAESILSKIDTMHWANDMIHTTFNQNVAVTGRLSSSGPNMQNTPTEIDELLISRYE